MASKIKVDQIEGSSGSTITVPTGQTFTITDGLAASTIGSGTLDVARLPTVTVAKGGTNLTSFAAGDILYATGSTTLAKLAKGTAAQTLKMNSGATAPEWTTVAAASSDFVKLATYNPSGAASVTMDGDYDSATYKSYHYKIYYLTPSGSNNANLYLRYNHSGTTQTGSHYDAAVTQGYNDLNGSSSAGSYNAGYNYDGHKITGGQWGNASTGGACGWINIYDPHSTTKYIRYDSMMGYQRTAHDTTVNDYTTGNYKQTGALTGILLYPSAGTFTGTIVVYGVK